MSLRLQDITVSYGQRDVVHVDDLRLNAGELIAIIGPNGAGKSTLLQVAAGVTRPTSGRVTLNGVTLGDLSPAERALVRSYLPQHQVAAVPFRVIEVVEMGRHARRRASMDDSTDEHAVQEALSAFDLDQLADRRLDELSGGEQARVAMARVIAQDAPVVLLDEPTAALDIAHQESTARRLRYLAHAGRIVVAVVHDINVAAAHAGRVIVVADGRIVTDGAPNDVLSSDVLTAVYGQPLAVIPHPFRPAPLVVSRAVDSGR